MLVVDVGDGAFKGSGVSGAGSHGMASLQVQEERVGIPAAAVQLDSEVELLPHHPFEEILRGAVVGLTGPHTFRIREDLHPVDGARSVLQQRGVEGSAQQGDEGLRIGGPERLDSGQGEHEVSQPAAPQHGDAAHPAKPLEDRAHQPRPFGRPAEFRPDYRTHESLLKRVAKLRPS